MPGQPVEPGTQNAAGLTQGSPPKAALNVWLTPAKGLPMTFSPGRWLPAPKLKGWPVCSVRYPLICQPCVNSFGPCDEPGIS